MKNLIILTALFSTLSFANTDTTVSTNSVADSLSVANTQNELIIGSGNNYTTNVSTRDMVPMVSAPGLTSSYSGCMGSSSAGGSAPGFGLSVGSTWVDEECTRRESAKLMASLGLPNIAAEVMCASEDVYRAVMAVANAVQNHPTEHDAPHAAPHVKVAFVCQPNAEFDKVETPNAVTPMSTYRTFNTTNSQWEDG